MAWTIAHMFLRLNPTLLLLGPFAGYFIVTCSAEKLGIIYIFNDITMVRAQVLY